MEAETIGAVLVRVQEAETLLRPLRERYEPAYRLGMPAHVTLMYPFPLQEGDAGAAFGRLAEALSVVPPFEFRLQESGRFERVVYLCADPAEPFRALTRSIMRSFPALQPYAGRYGSPEPHLSVARGEPHLLDDAEAALRRLIASQGPIRSCCHQAEVLGYRSGRWHAERVLPVGPGTG